MELCDYWSEENGAERCDLIDSACKCGGSGEQCSIKGRSITDVIRQAEKITLEQTSLDAQKRRHKYREAS